MKNFIQEYEKKCKELKCPPFPYIMQLEDSKERLDLSDATTFGAKNTICLSQALKKFDGFRSINLSESYMGDDGISLLCKSVENKKNLEELNLSGANISSKGSVGIGKLLKVNRSVKVLSLEWNSLGTVIEGMKNISSGLRKNSTLVELDLRNNRITSEGVLKLCDALVSNSKLKKIDLRWNSIGSNGAEYLRQVLEKDNTSLCEILLSGNDIDYETQDAIFLFLKRNQELESTLSMNVGKNGDSMSMEEMEGEESEESDVIVETEKIVRKKLEDEKLAKNLLEVSRMRETITKDGNYINELKGLLHQKDMESSGIRHTTVSLQATLDHKRATHEQELKKLNDDINHAKMMRNQTNLLLEKKTKELAKISIQYDEAKSTTLRLQETEKVLRERAETSESSLRTLRKDMNEKDREILKLKRELNIKSEENLALQVESKRAKDLEEELGVANMEIEKLKDSHLQERRKFERLKKNEILDLKNQHNQEKRELEEDRRKNNLSLEETNSILQEWKTNAEKYNKQLEEFRKDSKLKVEELRLKKNNVENENSGLRLEIKQLKYSITQMQIQERQNNKKYEREIYKLNEKMEDIIDIQEKEKQLFELRIGEKMKENEQLEKEIKRANFQLSNLKEKVNEKNLQIESSILKHVKEVFQNHSV